MARTTRNGQAVGGLPVPSPDELLIRAQNAQRVGRRREAAALAEEIGRVSVSDLDRAGDTRRVGGRFERLQRVPERRTRRSQTGGFESLASLLAALGSFGGGSDEGQDFLESLLR